MNLTRHAATIVLLVMTYIMSIDSAQAQSVDYIQCDSPRDSSSCYIAFQKLITIRNPISNKVYFDDGYHFYEGQLILFPDYSVAEEDLDGDGFKEIIVTIPETDEYTNGYFCKENGLKCPYFIFQDRNTDASKLSMKNVKTFGPIYSYGIGLSTDEKFGGFKSLLSYQDQNYEKFQVYQYDKKTDDYFNVTAPE